MRTNSLYSAAAESAQIADSIGPLSTKYSHQKPNNLWSTAKQSLGLIIRTMVPQACYTDNCCGDGRFIREEFGPATAATEDATA